MACEAATSGAIRDVRIPPKRLKRQQSQESREQTYCSKSVWRGERLSPPLIQYSQGCLKTTLYKDRRSGSSVLSVCSVPVSRFLKTKRSANGQGTAQFTSVRSKSCAQLKICCPQGCCSVSEKLKKPHYVQRCQLSRRRGLFLR